MTAPTKKKNRDALKSGACEIMAALMWGPKTTLEIAQYSGVAQETVRKWVNALAESGVAVEAGTRLTTPTARCPAKLWTLAVVPFGAPRQADAARSAA